ncbi:MAG: preprotein translocase subunit SecA [Lachnospiraceae bacterium]|nr:preprotein translocase subunit SecA [Lachnospiraceae bacterium]
MNKVNALQDVMREKSDEELAQMTSVFKNMLRRGKSEESILPEAFALVREAAKRTIGLFPYDEQVLGGIALYKGMFAEMMTGAGKTLCASMPLYVRALSGKSVILVTQNDYLAQRDAELLRPLYEFLGLTVRVRSAEVEGEQSEAKEKREIYAADIVYTTSSTLGFDYLMQNLSVSEEQSFLREFFYVIIDEVDVVLLDAASMPLVISGAPKVQSNLYNMADRFIVCLDPDMDYRIEDQQVYFTDRGIEKARTFFSIDNLFDEHHFELVRHLQLALRAHTLFEQNQEYVVQDGAVCLLEERSGRVLESTKLRAGQHQAIEAKEGVEITNDYRAMGIITYQDFYNMFPKLAGMTGTCMENAQEFADVYNIRTVKIPSHFPILRVDEEDVVCVSLHEQITMSVRRVEQCYEKRQPVLVVTPSIAISELYSRVLLREHIPHNVLNAYSLAREAEVIAEAGRAGSVTVATSVAGRGIDVQLDAKAKELGGLVVLGIGIMENIRLERQARGRSGRQGDPGRTCFYVCPDDKVVREYGATWLEEFRRKEQPASESVKKKMGRAIRDAQRIAEEKSKTVRMTTTDFGLSIQIQRNYIYKKRNEIITKMTYSLRDCLKMESEIIDCFLREHQPMTEDAVSRFVMENILYRFAGLPKGIKDAKQIKYYLLELAKLQLKRKLQLLGSDDSVRTFFQYMSLRAIDDSWIEQADYLSQLRDALSGRRVAQHNTLSDYHVEAYQSFLKMKKQIKIRMMRNLLLGELVIDKSGNLVLHFP